ncbi:hypothetical protein LTR53_006666 [Teratosphaeriaceae sp. CCFEE 6253]|nr:hypothetical protein LTR53_006666 [Teratosphaeriaceae sp. CCFEE 6253]
MLYLPSEVWLQVFSYCSLQDIWVTLRRLNRQLAACAEDVTIQSTLLSRFTVAIRFPLEPTGTDGEPREQVTLSTITFTFRELSSYNPTYALFGSCLVHPRRHYAQATQHWEWLAANQLGEQQWRVQHGYEGEVRIVRLPRLIVAEGEGVWCDWRELFDAYCTRRPTVHGHAESEHAE